MKRNKTIYAKESLGMLRQDCIMAGAFYWLKAEDQDENLVSALNRMKCRGLFERFAKLGIEPPSAAEMYAYAAERWPAHKLHPLKEVV